MSDTPSTASPVGEVPRTIGVKLLSAYVDALDRTGCSGHCEADYCSSNNAFNELGAYLESIESPDSVRVSRKEIEAVRDCADRIESDPRDIREDIADASTIFAATTRWLSGKESV